MESDKRYPRAVDVVVIGGGIIGVSTALALIQRGVSVALCEKGSIGGEQSGRNWGWVRAGIRDPREIPLAINALHDWDGLNRVVEAETGFRKTGSIFVCQTKAELERYEGWCGDARPFGLSSRMLTASETAALLPEASRRFLGALYTPTDGRAEPDLAAPAIAAAARKRGAILLQNTAVRGLDVAGGRAAGVVTEHGRIAADAVVVASGVWSRLFLQSQNLRLPQLKVQGSVLRTAPLARGPEGEGWLTGFAFRKRLDGGYTIAEGTENRVSIVPDHFRFIREFLPAFRSELASLTIRLDGRFLEEMLHWRPTDPNQVSLYERVRCLSPKPVAGSNRRALKAAIETFPVFRHAQVVQQWAGMIDVTPDAIPVVSEVRTLPGLFLSTGYSGHGFGLGPAAGRLTADIVTGRAPLVDPHPFRFSRFVDGSQTSVAKLT